MTKSKYTKSIINSSTIWFSLVHVIAVGSKLILRDNFQATLDSLLQRQSSNDMTVR